MSIVDKDGYYIKEMDNGKRYLCCDINITIPYSYVEIVNDYIKLIYENRRELDIEYLTNIVLATYNDIGLITDIDIIDYHSIQDWLKTMFSTKLYYENNRLRMLISNMIGKGHTKLILDVFSKDNKLGNEYILFITLKRSINKGYKL